VFHFYAISGHILVEVHGEGVERVVIARAHTRFVHAVFAVVLSVI